MIITLPKDALKYLDDKIIKVEINEKLLNKNRKISDVKKAKGILKKYLMDGTEYQNKVRKELERNN
ncbi:hypothetical protein [Ignavibacterium sp.]|uniref:hypothetical protein n=1 Tax=Ignavibacterium sp. TaxID=2651167 RepID=UPI0021FA6338|nr:hypothetical protein [Ignavibacterium sp.]BDQ02587.1 MAG: hypothetical protein KatS3mg037_1162 [Ignavibacterium sp.]